MGGGGEVVWPVGGGGGRQTFGFQTAPPPLFIVERTKIDFSRPRKKLELRPFLPEKGTEGRKCSAGPVARPEEFSRLRKVEPYSFLIHCWQRPTQPAMPLP